MNLPASYQALLQNFTQTSTGFTSSLSYPIKRSFKRVGITYGFDDSSVQTFSAASSDYFEALAYRTISGPNALTGITTSKIVPNFSYNQIDNPQHPHKGQSLYFAAEVRRPGRQRQVRQADCRIQAVHAREQGAQHGRLPGTGLVDYGLWRTSGSAV